jgi:hypothetical protein
MFLARHVCAKSFYFPKVSQTSVFRQSGNECLKASIANVKIPDVESLVEEAANRQLCNLALETDVHKHLPLCYQHLYSGGNN